MKTTLACAQCGAVFTSYNPNPKFCSKKCADEAKSAGVDPEKVRELYSSGLTQDQIATKLETTQKVIWRVMQKNGIQTRPHEFPQKK